MVRQHPEYITLRQQLAYSDPDWHPVIAEWDEINIQARGVAVSEALTSKTTAEEAMTAQMVFANKLESFNVRMRGMCSPYIFMHQG